MLRYLYHATYEPLLESIIEDGLGNTDATCWEDSAAGVVYLAGNYDLALSFAETNESVPVEWLGHIVVLEIPTKNLDCSLLSQDANVIADPSFGEEDLTYEYRGIIPWDDMSGAYKA